MFREIPESVAVCRVKCTTGSVNVLETRSPMITVKSLVSVSGLEFSLWAAFEPEKKQVLDIRQAKA